MTDGDDAAFLGLLLTFFLVEEAVFSLLSLLKHKESLEEDAEDPPQKSSTAVSTGPAAAAAEAAAGDCGILVMSLRNKQSVNRENCCSLRCVVCYLCLFTRGVPSFDTTLLVNGSTV